MTFPGIDPAGWHTRTCPYLTFGIGDDCDCGGSVRYAAMWAKRYAEPNDGADAAAAPTPIRPTAHPKGPTRMQHQPYDKFPTTADLVAAYDHRHAMPLGVLYGLFATDATDNSAPDEGTVRDRAGWRGVADRLQQWALAENIDEDLAELLADQARHAWERCRPLDPADPGHADELITKIYHAASWYRHRVMAGRTLAEGETPREGQGRVYSDYVGERTLYRCPDCGSLVVETAAHDEHHRRVEQ